MTKGGAGGNGGLETLEGSGSLEADKRAFILRRTVGLGSFSLSSDEEEASHSSSSSYIPGMFGARESRVVCGEAAGSGIGLRVRGAGAGGC